MFSNVFTKIPPFMRQCRKIWWRVRTTNDVAIWRLCVACWISKSTCRYAHTHATVHARSHTQISNIYCFSTATVIRESASVLRYMYTLLNHFCGTQVTTPMLRGFSLCCCIYVLTYAFETSLTCI